MSLLSVTVNLQGTTVERRLVGDDTLYGRHSYGGYPAHAGSARLIEMFARLAIRATVFVPAAEVELDRAHVEAWLAAGHEIAAHGWAMEEYGQQPAEQEAERLHQSHEVLTQLAGRAPRGWRAPHGRLGAQTLPALQRLGYLYDASFQDADHAYRLDADGAPGMIEVPQTEALVDATFYAARHTEQRLFKAWREEFDAMQAAGCDAVVTLHPRSDYGSARASRVRMLEAWLTDILSRPGVRSMTCEEVALGFSAR